MPTRKRPKIYTADDVLNAAKAAGMTYRRNLAGVSRIPNNLRLLNKFLDIWWDLFPTHYEKAHVKNKASKLGMITGFMVDSNRGTKVGLIIEEINAKARGWGKARPAHYTTMIQAENRPKDGRS